MAADPRRNPPPRWTVKKSGNLPSMQRWECHHANYGWGLPWLRRREAVAEAWQIQDVWDRPPESPDSDGSGSAR